MSVASSSVLKDKQVEDEFEEEDLHVPAGSNHPLSIFLGCLCFPFTICGSFFTLQEREEAVILRYGKYAGVIKEPGIHCSNCWGRTVLRVSTKTISVDLPNVKTADANGNPLIVSGVLSYTIRNPKKAKIDVSNSTAYVITQAQATLKQIVAKYPYESDAGHSLKSDGGAVGQEFVEILQERVRIAGVKVHSFAFNEISYAPEIAAGMLKRQQAAATVQARRVIVQGAVDIAHGAVTELAAKGIHLEAEHQSRLVTNVLTVMCSDRDAQPTVAL